MLELRGIDVHYGKQQVLHGVSLGVEPGEIVALIGPNAAGKSTTLRAACGLKGLSRGSVLVAGADLSGSSVASRLRRGLALVPEGRQVFGHFSVVDNLLMGAYLRADRKTLDKDLQQVFELFPRLGERSSQKAGSMSGGEQQMLAIGRGLMSRPSVLLLDEPTLGLAPAICRDLGGVLRRLADRGLAILVAEQNAGAALGCADRACVLESGRIALRGAAGELLRSEEIRRMYLGAAAAAA